MKNTISVIIPTYNRLSLLKEAIESVRRQTIENIEIVVVDDGSDDPVEVGIKTIDPSVIYLRQKNLGLNAARNFGLSEASGDFIALLDDDDLWLPFKTEIQSAVMERFPNISFTFSDFAIFDENGIKTENGLSTYNVSPEMWTFQNEYTISAFEIGLPLPPDGQNYRVIIGSLYYQLLHGPYVLPSTTLVRRSTIDEGAPFPENNIHCGDWQFFAKLTRESSCAFLTLATAMNRSHGDSVRLTRKSPLIRANDRLDLISDVWRKDNEFMGVHGNEVDLVEGMQLYKLVLMCLFENKRKEALQYLERWRRLPSTIFGLKGWLLNLVILIPFSSYIFQLMRHVKASGRSR